jgi:hypothetical protein
MVSLAQNGRVVIGQRLPDQFGDRLGPGWDDGLLATPAFDR